MSISPSPKNLAKDLVRRTLPKIQPRHSKPNRDGFPESVKQIISRRSAGLCELDFCGPAEVIHHRRPRGSGGTSLDWVNRAANGLHLANACHDRVEGRHPEWSRVRSRAHGWLVSRNGLRIADQVPVLYRGQWVLLRDDGTVTPIEGAAA